MSEHRKLPCASLYPAIRGVSGSDRSGGAPHMRRLPIVASFARREGLGDQGRRRSAFLSYYHACG